MDRGNNGTISTFYSRRSPGQSSVSADERVSEPYVYGRRMTLNAERGREIGKERKRGIRLESYEWLQREGEKEGGKGREKEEEKERVEEERKKE